MPKLARYMLVWSSVDERYELRERGSETNHPVQEDDAWWSDWLSEHTSFSFQGRQGHLNLLKEARARGTDYWYAYHNLDKHTSKKYAGRTADLTVERLEELAGAFPRKSSVPPSPVSAADLSSQAHRELLLEPKLRPPRMPAALIERERLYARLNAGLACKLTLLCAPAGFGKTTLAGQWLDARPVPTRLWPAAWISLDSGDNDPIRFWRYVITACQSFGEGIGRVSLAQISTGLSPALELPSLEQLLTPLLNELTHAESSGLLILEDYHLITEAHIHETMIFFLEHLPATIHVIMLTRSEPPFPLSRWRVRGELCEVQAGDLRFSQEETEHFFQRSPVFDPLLFSTEELSQLHERVEGWAAGLRLLLLTLQGSLSHEGLTRAMAHFVGDQRSLQEYFVTEVLYALPDELQDFLLRTSVLNRLTGDLCDAVTERQASEHDLEVIERAGLFLEALNGAGKWYRYHALFAEAMRAEARRRLGVDTLCALYLRASVWYEQEKMLAEAIEASFQAQDISRAASLIECLLEKPANFLFNSELFQQAPEFHTLRRWLEQLPETLIRFHPLLCLGYAASIVFVFILGQEQPSPTAIVQLFGALQLAEDGWKREGNLVRLGEVYAFRALILKQPGAIRDAVFYAQQSLDLLPPDANDSRTMILWLMGMGELQAGHFNAAREAMLQVRVLCEAMGSAPILRANTVWLSGLMYAQGELHRADVSFRQLLAEARTMDDTDDVCDALLGLAQLAYAWNDLTQAEEQAREAFELSQRLGNEELQVQATLILARIEQARGHISAAQQRCIEQQTRLSTTVLQRPRWLREIRAMQARLALTQGDVAAVERWHYSLDVSDDPSAVLREQENLLWIRYQLAQGRAEDVLRLLEELHTDAQQEGRTLHAWEMQILQVQAHAMLKDTRLARKLLREVIERAHIEGFLRLFLDEGEFLVPLLQALVPLVANEAQRSFLRRLLFAFAQQWTTHGQPPALIESLSMQEQRVLNLLAAGQTNPEIARELVVSINTIKAHVQSIYHKLNVNNRVEASEVARMLKLL